MPTLVEKIRKRLDRKFLRMAKEDRLHWLPDKLFLSWMFRIKMGYKLDWKNPRTLNEKLQWLKFYNKNPQYTEMVDKYGVREYVKKTIGEEYLIPLLGVWDKFDDIDFDKLPKEFVLKCSHDSGGLVICRNKDELDKAAAREKIGKSLARNYYYRWREWPYRNIRPRIIAEQFMEDDLLGGLPDYKFFCFDGRVDCVMVCVDRHLHDVKFYFFDRDWKFLKPNIEVQDLPDDFTIPKPPCIDEMFGIAAKLSKGLPFSRIDLYCVSGKVYFGEITFFPDSGYDTTFLKEADLKWGDMITLPPKRR